MPKPSAAGGISPWDPVFKDVACCTYAYADINLIEPYDNTACEDVHTWVTRIHHVRSEQNRRGERTCSVSCVSTTKTLWLDRIYIIVALITPSLAK